MKQLKIGETTLTVENVYPFRYDYGQGKQVLRISVLEENHSFTDLMILKNCEADIEYLEDEVSKIIYSNYSLDFNCQYNAGIFNIEITRKTDELIRLEALERAFSQLSGAQ